MQNDLLLNLWVGNLTWYMVMVRPVSCKSIRASAVKSFSVVHAQDAPSLTILPCKAQLTVMMNIIGKL